MNATLELLRTKADLLLKCNQQTINETEIVEVLGNELPELNPALERTENINKIYKVMQCFANFTKHHISKGDFKEVKHCFNVAETMLKNGNSTVKNAIENGYLYSLSSVLDLTTPLAQKIKGLLTDSLKKEYNRQVCTSGI
jgi:hypothetical protein